MQYDIEEHDIQTIWPLTNLPFACEEVNRNSENGGSCRALNINVVSDWSTIAWSFGDKSGSDRSHIVKPSEAPGIFSRYGQRIIALLGKLADHEQVEAGEKECKCDIGIRRHDFERVCRDNIIKVDGRLASFDEQCAV